VKSLPGWVVADLAQPDGEVGDGDDVQRDVHPVTRCRCGDAEQRHDHEQRPDREAALTGGQARYCDDPAAGSRSVTSADRLTFVAADRGISSTSSTVFGTLYAASRSFA